MNRWRILTKLGMTVALAASVPACVFTASGRVRTSGAVITEAPPAPQNEVVEARPGYVWVSGHWAWQGRWVWTAGHWERERAGYAYAQGSWQQQGNQWVWTEGTWRTAGAHGTVVVHENTNVPPPDDRPKVIDHRNDGNVGGGTTVVVVDQTHPHQPPPEPRAENPGARGGYVWITGRWDWAQTNGQYQWSWVPGHWERARANKTWNDGRWELQGDTYVWVEGSWGDAPQDRVKVRDHRH